MLQYMIIRMQKSFTGYDYWKKNPFNEIETILKILLKVFKNL